MQLPLYQVDAFAGRLFAGNPAAVCPLDRWLPDETMQSIAAENNLSETAFFVPSADGFDLRWFTPTVETALCGHATLASGFVVMTALAPDQSAVRFHTKSGPLEVTRQGDRFALSLPAQPGQLCPVPKGLTEALGRAPRQMLAAQKYLAIFDDEVDVAAIEPDFDVIAELDRDGLIISAPGRTVDSVSRYFAPHAGIPEDPVTGSAHCTLVPYWSKRLGKKQLIARQISHRGGELACEDRGDRVVLSGRAVLYLEGRIHV
jgi:PhzF family phenazine biosynthesis protein